MKDIEKWILRRLSEGYSKEEIKVSLKQAGHPESSLALVDKIQVRSKKENTIKVGALIVIIILVFGVLYYLYSLPKPNLEETLFHQDFFSIRYRVYDVKTYSNYELTYEGEKADIITKMLLVPFKEWCEKKEISCEGNLDFYEYLQTNTNFANKFFDTSKFDGSDGEITVFGPYGLTLEDIENLQRTKHVERIRLNLTLSKQFYPNAENSHSKMCANFNLPFMSRGYVRLKFEDYSIEYNPELTLLEGDYENFVADKRHLSSTDSEVVYTEPKQVRICYNLYSDYCKGIPDAECFADQTLPCTTDLGFSGVKRCLDGCKFSDCELKLDIEDCKLKEGLFNLCCFEDDVLGYCDDKTTFKPKEQVIIIVNITEAIKQKGFNFDTYQVCEKSHISQEGMSYSQSVSPTTLFIEKDGEYTYACSSILGMDWPRKSIVGGILPDKKGDVILLELYIFTNTKFKNVEELKANLDKGQVLFSLKGTIS